MLTGQTREGGRGRYYAATTPYPPISAPAPFHSASPYFPCPKTPAPRPTCRKFHFLFRLRLLNFWPRPRHFRIRVFSTIYDYLIPTLAILLFERKERNKQTKRKKTSDAGSQYCCGRVGRGIQPPSTPKPTPNTQTYTKSI